MTREEQILNGFTEMMKGFWNNQDLKVPDIEILKSKTTLEEHTICKQEPCEDCISRQAVDRLVWEYLKKGSDENVAFYEHFLDLPSVTPQQKVGRWINGDHICPCCGENKFKDLDADIWADWQPKYCPNCGAKMIKSQKSEEV